MSIPCGNTFSYQDQGHLSMSRSNIKVTYEVTFSKKTLILAIEWYVIQLSYFKYIPDGRTFAFVPKY